ncbi:Scr1 family TA system antitoxin-like transcriptional regulator [Streptomyces sp. NPDC052494]|uniref:Scr1 family TA system antitoxin-like transcriptional regulator n=1 Tax=Streptomyces sp. NPDC052494 TaxID=3365692 RepID=UPI0037D3A757
MSSRLQALPHTAGAHPGLSGQFSLLQFPDSREAVVYLEKFTSDLYLEKPSDVQHYSATYTHLQTQALSPDHTRHFITETIKPYTS